MEADRHLEAGTQFETAARLNPNEYESVFNAAVAYRQAQKYDRAEEFYRRAVRMKPEVGSKNRFLSELLEGKLSIAVSMFLRGFGVETKQFNIIFEI